MAGISNNPNSPRQRMINLMYLVIHRHDGTDVSSGGAWMDLSW